MPTYNASEAVLPVKDLEAGRKFYEQTLGLTLEEETPAGIRYTAGSGRVFVYQSEFAGTNKATAAGFEVADLEGAMAELRAAGVTFQDFDVPGLKTENGIASLGGNRAAWFSDPDGNILALDQRGEA